MYLTQKQKQVLFERFMKERHDRGESIGLDLVINVIHELDSDIWNEEGEVIAVEDRDRPSNEVSVAYLESKAWGVIKH